MSLGLQPAALGRIFAVAVTALMTAVAVFGADIDSAVNPFDRVTTVNVAGQNLDGALRALAKQANLQIVFDAALVSGRTVPAVNDKTSPRRVIDRWLSGTHLIAEEQSLGVIVVRTGKALPRWLMMVATQCTDPARDTDFNAWYNDIDIPDVLEVPGYQRARRGVIAERAAPDSTGRYVALYDIRSRAIDKTIIDMLMATRKMEARHRSTDLLKVTERVYYQERSSTVASAAAGSAAGQQFLYIERADCCKDATAEHRFNAWYDNSHVPRLLMLAGMQRATRFQLYRVLMIEEQTASKYLTVYELTAPSAAAAQDLIDRARRDLLVGAPKDQWTMQRSVLFQQIRDVVRPAPARSGERSR